MDWIPKTDRRIFFYCIKRRLTKKLVSDADPVSDDFVGEDDSVDEGHDGGFVRSQLGLSHFVHKQTHPVL